LLFVPKSAFCSIADVYTAEVEASGKEFILILKGGDASEAYVSNIRFDEKRIIDRNLSSQMAPDAMVEVTTYIRRIEIVDK